MRYLSIIASTALFLAVTFATAAPRFTEKEDYFQQLRRYYPSPATTDWEHQYSGEYFVENNVWNKGSTESYRQEIGIVGNSDSSVSVAWAWNWPTSSEIVAFPDVIYGKNPWAAESSTPKMPVAIKDLDTLTAEFEFSHYGDGHRNSSFQIWLTTDSADDRHLLNEIMIWIRNDNLPLAPFLKKDSVVGEPFTITRLENHGDPNLTPPVHWDYYAFVNPSLDWKGKIDLLAFFQYLIKNELINPDAYIAVINFGNEIRDGSGITALDHYRIRLVRKRGALKLNPLSREASRGNGYTLNAPTGKLTAGASIQYQVPQQGASFEIFDLQGKLLSRRVLEGTQGRIPEETWNKLPRGSYVLGLEKNSVMRASMLVYKQ